MVQLNDATAMAPFDMGLTLHYVDMDQCLPGAAAFARQFEGELGLHEGTVRISVFNSPRDDGLPCHYDPTELISIQLHGTKEFRYAPVQEIRDPCGNQFVPMGPVFDDLYAQATHGFPEPGTANFERVRMEPGSVLFLPRGTWHHTVASEDSLSISIMINVPPAMIPLLEQLGQLLLQDSAWRRPFFGRCGTRGHDRDARDQAARLLAALPATIARLSPDDLVEAAASPERRLQRISEQSRFQRTPNGWLQFEDEMANGLPVITLQVRHNASVTAQSAKIAVPAASLPLFRWLEAQTSGPFSAAQMQAAFPAEPFVDLKSYLELCVKAQFLKLLWFASLEPPAK